MPKVVIERKTKDKDGNNVSEYTVHQTTRMRKYYKTYAFPDAEVPCYFMQAVLRAAYLDPVSKCYGVETALVVQYISGASRGTLQRYIKELCEVEFLYKIHNGKYLVNPGYMHTGSQYATDSAIMYFDSLMRDKYVRDGRNADEYVSITDQITKKRKRSNEETY